MKKIVLVFFVWLLVINIFGFLVANRFNLTGDTAYTWITQSSFKTWNILDIHARWDSDFYLDIARNGYMNKSNELSNIVFFPLYPFLIKLFSLLVRNFVLAGIIVSILSLFGALYYLYKLVSEFHRGIDPIFVISFLLIFPTAFFFNTVYAESLFLFLSIACFYYAFRKNFLIASVFGILAALTRVTGVLLFLPLLYEFLKTERKLNIRILYLGLIPLGTFLFFLYHKIAFGDFFLFFKTEKLWGRAFKFNADHFQFLTHPQISNFTLDLFFAVFALIVSYLVYRKIGKSYGIYMFVSLLVALGTGTLMSINRYIAVLFPIYIFAGSIENKIAQISWAFISILLLALYITLFVNWYWAG